MLSVTVATRVRLVARVPLSSLVFHSYSARIPLSSLAKVLGELRKDKRFTMFKQIGDVSVGVTAEQINASSLDAKD